MSVMKMKGERAVAWLLFMILGGLSRTAEAFDSYRYLHVTIDTPWLIFLFLLPAVLAPLILMVVLYWRFAVRRSNEEKQEEMRDD